MENKKVLEGVEEALQKAFELEMDCIISFDRCVYTKNKKYFLSTTLKPIDEEDKTQTEEVQGK